MKEISYQELNGGGTYILTVTCRRCGHEINRTRLLQANTIKKLHKDAEANPMVNWCQACNTSADVHIWEVYDGEMDGNVYLLSLEAQLMEIDSFCFRECGKISIGCIVIPTEEGEASFMPCRVKSCTYAEKEIDIGDGKTRDSMNHHYIVRRLIPAK